MRSPLLYPLLMAFNRIAYPLVKKGWPVITNTFFNKPFRTILPSGTDVVLNGIKSHDSEIRLAEYLVLELKEGDTFIDVGAHYGYYSLLAASIVGKKGKIFSIEASGSTYKILKKNIEYDENIESTNMAAGDSTGSITFYEYPGPYAEYNTTVQGIYVNQPWYRSVKETINTVQILVLDDLIKQKGIENAFIKIDAEGGEAAVLRGLQKSLKEKNLILAVEYLLTSGGSSHHHDAVDILYRDHYKGHAILSGGELKPIENIDRYLAESGLSSDNIIFKR
ncbi:MAG: FkbM family methyltransferase [Saprospiraceae bacterium]